METRFCSMKKFKDNKMSCWQCLLWLVRSMLRCGDCGQELGPPGRIYQCSLAHTLCQPCHQLSHYKVPTKCTVTIVRCI